MQAAVARNRFRSKDVQGTTCGYHFWTLKRHSVWQGQGILHLAKSEQNVRFCSNSKNVGRHGTFEEDLQRCMLSGKRNTRDT